MKKLTIIKLTMKNSIPKHQLKNIKGGCGDDDTPVYDLDRTVEP